MAERKSLSTPRGQGRISDVGGSSRTSSVERGAGRGMRGGGRGGRAKFVFQDTIRTREQSLISKKGSSGTEVRLLGNYFRLSKTPDWNIFQYHVTFFPEVEVNIVKKGLLRTFSSLFDGYIFDGTCLFLTKRLDQDVLQLEAINRSQEKIGITVKYTGHVSMMQGRSIQILNIIMRKALEGLNLQLVGRNFFDPFAKSKIPEHNIELWPGYITSIRQYERDLLLCAEITHKVMRTDTIHDILRQTTQKSRGSWKEDFMKIVIGMTVLTDYNNKFYRIDDVDFSTTPASKFPTKEGEISYVDYYRKKYNKNIYDQGQPMLISNPKARDMRAGKADFIALVPELCRATGISNEMRNNIQLMRKMADKTRVLPDARIRKLTEFNNRLYDSAESVDVFKKWHMDLDRNVVQIRGRELKKEMIVFGDMNKKETNQFADWTHHLRGSVRLFQTEHMRNWVVVHLEKHTHDVRRFVDLICKSGHGMGIYFDRPMFRGLRDDRSQSYTLAIDQCLSQSDVQAILFIVPDNRGDRYTAIKKKCCVERAIPSQVIVYRTISKQNMSVATKVAIQMNCKLGQLAWNIAMPLSGLMTVGFDVSVDSANKSKSFGAFVASMDLKLPNAKFFSAVSEHSDGNFSHDIGMNLLKALHVYKDICKALPDKILFYRDGVGEGQLQYIIDHEVDNIKRKLDKIYEGGSQACKWAYIVVSKRVNARFFTAGGTNPNPGTIIDDVVTVPESYDFYLVSQCVRQGTVSPTYYNIIVNNLGLEPDKMQILTYKLCHLYYNWSGTIRVPAVCQYAQKLAFFSAQFLHQLPENRLERKLFFL